ncbi:hypothetical protein VMCG_07779 [Cytospora schulzeri]|uniref:Calcineurin-like phosphoesterase domain-containing protein n=1 Tax=Cytospora schulzeri TaxID=448051 RepID=A0A423VZV4_9PEZI|nr:hypothetical protein VMCG_07779 [Valsa malicola]
MASSSFQILSDLHLETHGSYDFAFQQTSPNLALIGDIGQAADDGVFVFIEKQVKRYWNVVLILGNHEPYGTTWDMAKSRIHAFEARMSSLRASSTIGRFLFLDQGRWDVNDTLTILGCTLFSKILSEQIVEVANRLNDFQKIKDWDIEDYVAAHQSDLKWLNDQVRTISITEPQRQIAIFSHYSPTVDNRAVDPRHQYSPVSSGFATDLGREECWRNKNVIFWAFGHTRYNCDFMDEHGKRVAANQKGYKTALEADCDVKKVYYIGRETGSGLLIVRNPVLCRDPALHLVREDALDHLVVPTAIFCLHLVVPDAWVHEAAGHLLLRISVYIEHIYDYLDAVKEPGFEESLPPKVRGFHFDRLNGLDAGEWPFIPFQKQYMAKLDGKEDETSKKSDAE